MVSPLSLPSGQCLARSMTARIRWRKTAMIGPLAYSLHSGGYVPTARRLEALMGIPNGTA